MSSSSHEHIDHLARDYGTDFTPDVESGLARLHDRLNSKAEAKKAKVRSLSFRRVLTIAATVLLLVGAGFYLLSPGVTTVTNDGAPPLSVNLPDGSTVTLQSGSTLSYDGAYAGAERKVELAGQGYFEVAPNIDRPFLVTTGGTTLRVVGTAFNLRVSDDELEVEVSEGTVELAYADSVLPITAKQCGIAKAGASPMMMDAPHLNRHAWRTGHIVFENTPVAEALRVLHNNWAVEVELPKDCDFPLSLSYNTKDVDAILSNIASLSGGSIESLGGKKYRLLGVCK